MNKMVYLVNIYSKDTSYGFVYVTRSHFHLCRGDRFLNNLEHNDVDHARKKTEVTKAKG